MKSLFKAILDKKTPLLFLSLFVAIIGVKVFLHMPRGLFPEVNYPRVVVDVNMGFTPLPIMEWGVTTVLEKELRAVPGVRIVKSSTSRGLSTIQVFLRENEDVTLATQRVNAKIAEIRSLIPANAIISIRPITASTFTAAEYCFSSSKMSAQELRTFVEYTLKPLVLVQPGIFNAKVLGGTLPEYQIKLDPKKMAYYNLTVLDIDDRVKNSNSVDFIGPVDQKGKEILAFGGKLAHNTNDLGNLVVSSNLGNPVLLKDISGIKLGDAWKYKDLSLNGNECVALDVFYQSGIDQSITSKAVKTTIAQEVSKLNGKIVYRSWDLNDFTDTATNAVIIDLAIGMVIIALVTFLFLGSVKYSVFALVVMPLAATFTFLAMSWLGLSINLMTLGGLTAAIGLVVDNTVIVLELYHHKRQTEPDKSVIQILGEVLSTVFRPMLFGTFTIALVFTPIGLLSGISGMFFEPMAHVHGSALMISLILAIVVVPAFILIFDKGKVRHSEGLIKESAVNRPYAFILDKLLGSPKRNGILIFSFFLLGLIAFPFAKTGFLPEWDEGDMVIDFRANDPLSLKSTVAGLKPLEGYLKTIPEIDFFIRKTGTSLGSFDKSPYLGEIVLKLKKDRKKSVFELREEISNHAQKYVPDFDLDFFQILPDRLNDLSGSGKPVVIFLRGEDDDELTRAAELFVEKLTKVEGLDSVRIDESPKTEEIVYSVNEDLSRAVEMNPSGIVQNARLALFSLDSSAIQSGPQSIPIRLTLKNDDKNSAEGIENLPLYTLRGGLKHLNSVGHVKTQLSKVESTHIDGNPVKIVTAELAGRDLGAVITDVKKVLSENEVAGVSYQLAGEYQNQQESFHELIIAFVTGLALIFLTSLFYSNRFSTALGLTGCSLIPPIVGLVGLVLSGTPLDVSSFSGLISVTGIAVANSFMAIAAIEAHPEWSTNFNMAVREGMKSRVRPILMTNLAAMAGFIPIAMGLAEGDEILRPFSIAIIVGLFGAMFTTLYMMPICYSVFGKPKIQKDEL